MMFWPFCKKPPSEWLTVGCVSVRDYRGYTLVVSLCGLLHDGYTWEAVLNTPQTYSQERTRRLSTRLGHFWNTRNVYILDRDEAMQQAIEAVNCHISIADANSWEESSPSDVA